MKSNGWTRTSTGLIFGLGLILAVVGCGVKGPPVPPRSVPPGAITDLGYTIDQDQVTLTWSIPTGEAAGSAGLAGFVVYRATISAAEPVCDGCPVLFRRLSSKRLKGAINIYSKWWLFLKMGNRVPIPIG